MPDEHTGCEVRFLPYQRALIAERGSTLLDCAIDNGIDLEHECGGGCSCTTCKVQVIDGEWNLSRMESPERERLEMELGHAEGCRLACQALVLRGRVVVQLIDSK